MNTAKLQEALEEMIIQRSKLDAAIDNLRHIIQMFSSDDLQYRRASARQEPLLEATISTPPSPLPDLPQGLFEQHPPTVLRSYIDDSVAAIQKEGRPLHAKELAQHISAMRGKTVSRGVVESTLLRHIKDLGPRSRLRRSAPSTYDLAAVTAA